MERLSGFPDLYEDQSLYEEFYKYEHYEKQFQVCCYGCGHSVRCQKISSKPLKCEKKHRFFNKRLRNRSGCCNQQLEIHSNDKKSEKDSAKNLKKDKSKKDKSNKERGAGYSSGEYTLKSINARKKDVTYSLPGSVSFRKNILKPNKKLGNENQNMNITENSFRV